MGYQGQEGQHQRGKAAPTYPGLLLAFQLAAQGETDKAIAQALNGKGYRTHGTHGSNPFSKDTVGGILVNRFYIGELPDSKGGWIKGKHNPIIAPELFQAAQDSRGRRRALPQTIPSTSQRRSLSGLAHCAVCGSRLRVVSLPTSRGMLCSRRIDKGGCEQPVARLPHLEGQIAAYFKAFKLPHDYREKMLALCQGVVGGKDAADGEIASIKARLNRIKELYTWGDMEKAEYLAERQQLQAQLAKLEVHDKKTDYLDRVAQFLDNLALAWEAADQEKRNRLAVELFEAVWVKDNLVLGVTPRPEFIPFFDVIYSGCQTSLQTGGSDGIRTRVLDLDRIACLATTPRSRNENNMGENKKDRKR